MPTGTQGRHGADYIRLARSALRSAGTTGRIRNLNTAVEGTTARENPLSRRVTRARKLPIHIQHVGDMFHPRGQFMRS
jgi:uncharacterized protein YqgV (UPF0045/DUF77 family)